MKTSAIALILDRIAEAHGITARHVSRSPALLAAAGLEPDDIDDETITEAEQYHRSEVWRIIGKYGVSYSR